MTKQKKPRVIRATALEVEAEARDTGGIFKIRAKTRTGQHLELELTCRDVDDLTCVAIACWNIVNKHQRWLKYVKDCLRDGEEVNP